MNAFERIIYSRTLNFILFTLAFFMAVINIIAFVQGENPGYLILAAIMGFVAYAILEDEVALEETRNRLSSNTTPAPEDVRKWLETPGTTVHFCGKSFVTGEPVATGSDTTSIKLTPIDSDGDPYFRQ